MKNRRCLISKGKKTNNEFWWPQLTQPHFSMRLSLPVSYATRWSIFVDSDWTIFWGARNKSGIRAPAWILRRMNLIYDRLYYRYAGSGHRGEGSGIGLSLIRNCCGWRRNDTNYEDDLFSRVQFYFYIGFVLLSTTALETGKTKDSTIQKHHSSHYYQKRRSRVVSSSNGGGLSNCVM